MAKDYTQVNFRIPTSLKEKIDKAASENEQSITAEIVERLEKSFNPFDGNENQAQFLQTASISLILAAAKAFEKKGLEWSEVQNNLIEVSKELIEIVKDNQEK